MKRRRWLGPAMEAIAFKGKHPLFIELTDVFRDRGDLSEKAITDKLAEVIKKRLNAKKVTISVTGPEHGDANAVAMVLPVDYNSIFSQVLAGEHPAIELDFDPTLYGKLAKSFDKAMGTVEIDGRLTGLFSKIPMEIVLTHDYINGSHGLDPDEQAAILIHEIGHFETTYMVMGQVVTASVIMTMAIDDFKRCKDHTTRERVVEAAIKHLTTDSDRINMSKLADEDDARNFEAVMIREVMEEAKVDVGNIRHYNGEAEYLADSFAIHMGAGKALASGYYKLAKSAYGKSGPLQSYGNYLVTEATKMGMLAATVMWPPAAAVATVVVASILVCNTEDNIERNTVKERLENMHNSLVQMAKDQSLPRNLAKDVLKDAEFVSGIMESVNDRLSFLGAISHTLNKRLRKDHAQIEMQRSLARLANNPLFLRSLELKHL